MLLTGAEIAVECLIEQGVDTIFGYPGGTILNVYDALYKRQDKINHVLTSHEQGAAHAADGYARASGKTGVCFATSGPGATNLVTGIATAYMDSIPLVAITCNVNLPLLGKDTFQEVDIVGITMPITKHGFIVKDVKVLADTIRRAFLIASSGRPGPVIVDITKDVTAAKCEYSPQPAVQKKKNPVFTEESILGAAELINNSKRPFIYIGGGAQQSGCTETISELVRRTDAPVCETLMAQGVFDQHDPHYTGMIGMHGTKATNFGVAKCDLLIALGARFSDRVTGNASRFAPNAKILHIDIDAAEINKNVHADYEIVGDLSEVMDRLIPHIVENPRTEWMNTVSDLREKYPMSYPSGKFCAPRIMEILDEMTSGKALICTDVGQHQMWAAQYYTYSEPRTFLSSGGLGTMGYGLGAAIGAKYARPDKTVVNIAGDGCFRMNLNELATASRYNVPVIEIIINNHVLGMVRQWQNLFYGQRYSATVLDDSVDFVRTAQGLGCEAFRVTSEQELRDALAVALEGKGPVVLDCIIDKDDKVFPMVSPGAGIDEAFDADDLEKC